VQSSCAGGSWYIGAEFPPSGLSVTLLLLLALVALVGLFVSGALAQETPEEVEFRFDPSQAGRDHVERVCLAGDFNDWHESDWPLERGTDGVFRRVVSLRPGVYRYKLVVDGEWQQDPVNPLREPGGHHNSVLVVGDVEVPDLADLERLARIAPSDGRPHPREGRPGALRTIPAEDLPAPPGGLAPRPLYVYLPPSYDERPDARYPVLYLHDGQNVWSDPDCCFGHGGWYLEVTCERLWAEGRLREVILVGVPNSPDRMREYGTPDMLGAADDPYVRYLVDVVKPFVDERYRTRPGPEDTAAMGSSLGGLVSFTLAFTHPDVFGQVACLSSSFWFEAARGHDAFDVLAERGKLPVRIYIDSGTAGESQDGAPNTRRMARLLDEAGWTPGVDLEHFEDTGAGHNERAWRARAERPLLFLFPARR
jgi:enterochelin esterase-like enzyme